MNAIPMISHSGYHQRDYNATCAQCGNPVAFYVLGLRVACVNCHEFVEPVPVGPCPVCAG
jgi:hypothetical protein